MSGRPVRALAVAVPLLLQQHPAFRSGVDVVRASSDPGFTMINVIFEEQVDRQTAREQVATQLAEAQLPLPQGV